MTCSCEFSWKITFKFKHLEHFKGYYIHTLTSTCLFVVFLDNWEINKISSNWLFFTLNIFSRLKVLTFLHLIWSLIGFHQPLSRTFLITLKKQFNLSQEMLCLCFYVYVSSFQDQKMATLPPAISNAGGSKKPFSYCPGGIDFSELKSPKIARRIAKHQAGINEPSSTLPPQQKVSLMKMKMLLMMIMNLLDTNSRSCNSTHCASSYKCESWILLQQHQNTSQQAGDRKTEKYQWSSVFRCGY